MINFAEVFYNHFEETDRKIEKAEEVTFAPSYLNDCKRKIYYKKTGEAVSNPIDLPALFKMHFGKVQHEGLQEILKAKGIMIECEKHRQAEYNGLTFNYYLDGIVKDGDQEAIMEIKTIYGNAFNYIEDEPKEDHMFQVLSYLAFTGIKRAYVVYVGRDNGLIRQHVIESRGDLMLNGSTANQWRKRWKDKMDELPKLKADIEAGKLPERDFSLYAKKVNGKINFEFQHESKKYKTDWHCNYCAYCNKCWELDKWINSEEIMFFGGKK